MYRPGIKSMIASDNKTALLNDKFSRAVLFVTILFSAIECSSQIFAIIAGFRPVEFPFKVFLPGDFPGVQFLLAQ